MSLYLGNTPICGGIEGNQLNNPFSLLDYKYSEYELSNASWLLSNGQWNSGAVYQSVYDLLLQIYNGTVTKAGVSVKLSTETYADTDFVLNTGDTTFRLPIKVLMAGSKRIAGNGMTLGLTNGTTNFSLGGYNSNTVTLTKTIGYNQNVNNTDATTGAITLGLYGVTTDETKSGIETSANGLYLYFYVGETVQDANIIAAASVLTDIADLKAHSIVETYVNGTSWYRVYSDGWCEQGGEVTGLAVNTYGTVNLLKAFANTNYNITTSYQSSSASYPNTLSIAYYDKSTNSFKIGTRYIADGTMCTAISWLAKGYIS